MGAAIKTAVTLAVLALLPACNAVLWQTIGTVGAFLVALVALGGNVALWVLRRGDVVKREKLEETLREQQQKLNEHALKQIEASKLPRFTVEWGPKDRLVLTNNGPGTATGIEVELVAKNGRPVKVMHPPLPWPTLAERAPLPLLVQRHMGLEPPYAMKIHFHPDGGEIETVECDVWPPL